MTSCYLDLPRRDLDEVLRERTAITADQAMTSPTRDDHIHALECSLSFLSGIDAALTLLTNSSLSPPESEAFGYLAERLHVERKAADAAFHALFYPDQRAKSAATDNLASIEATSAE